MKLKICLGLILSAFLSTAHAEPDATVNSHPNLRYKVTITNLTRGQIFSPPVLATHQRKFQLFQAGAAASQGIAVLAEDGATAPLVTEIKNSGVSQDIQVGSGPIPAGASMSYEIKGSQDSVLSLATMLVTTNDGFAGVTGAMLPKDRVSFYVPAYDAGSEANTESCAHIPGPPCSAHNVRQPEGAEGFIHIHRGIQGIGDLAKENLDWRNPVAMITIECL